MSYNQFLFYDSKFQQLSLAAHNPETRPKNPFLLTNNPVPEENFLNNQAQQLIGASKKIESGLNLQESKFSGLTPDYKKNQNDGRSPDLILRNPNPISNFYASDVSNTEPLIGFSKVQNRKKSSMMISNLARNQNSNIMSRYLLAFKANE